MVGLVIVSHSATLAGGVVELARQMGGANVVIEAAGGMAEPEGAIGTDVELVQAAIGRAAGPDGVLVLMDLGSAVMSAEMAAEMIGMESEVRVVLSEAPLVEGAVAAAARAGAGAPLDEVAAEARAALGMKAASLGVEPDEPAAPAAPVPDVGSQADETRLEVGNALGLHARPAALIVETAGRFDAQVAVHDETTGKGPADARSLTGLVTLGARRGHTLLVRAGGPDAHAALRAFEELAATGFGDGLGAAPAAPAVAAAGADGAAVDGGAAGDRRHAARRPGRLRHRDRGGARAARGRRAGRRDGRADGRPRAGARAPGRGARGGARRRRGGPRPHREPGGRGRGRDLRRPAAPLRGRRADRAGARRRRGGHGRRAGLGRCRGGGGRRVPRARRRLSARARGRHRGRRHDRPAPPDRRARSRGARGRGDPRRR